jgi:hypothetical protein
VAYPILRWFLSGRHPGFWDFVPPNPWGWGPLLAIASIGQGDSPAWSDVLNDGDAGTINIYAAPREPFGTVSFSCH